jgi:hypothetical protein
MYHRRHVLGAHTDFPQTETNDFFLVTLVHDVGVYGCAQGFWDNQMIRQDFTEARQPKAQPQIKKDWSLMIVTSAFPNVVTGEQGTVQTRYNLQC